MGKNLGEQFADLLRLFEQGSALNAQTAEGLLKSTQTFAEELMRFRAWEAILYLFFARYYFSKEDPVGAATWDRDFLAAQRRQHAQDEEGALQIEKTYQTLFVMLEAAQKHGAGLSEENEDPFVM